eukprot:c12117_g1_i1.p1 GENE.c12117_g1_i1~~c12117_g1_i1.p1  ORF type:complete len:162 (+),score=19.54 c12117_g1_i1:60-488(+)
MKLLMAIVLVLMCGLGLVTAQPPDPGPLPEVPTPVPVPTPTPQPLQIPPIFLLPWLLPFMVHPVFYLMGLPLWIAYANALFGQNGGSLSSFGPSSGLFSPLAHPLLPAAQNNAAQQQSLMQHVQPVIYTGALENQNLHFAMP